MENKINENDTEGLDILTNLQNLQGTAFFFKNEANILSNIIINRKTTEFLVQYIKKTQSCLAWKTLLQKGWRYLCQNEQNEMLCEAIKNLSPEIIKLWLKEE